MHFAHCFAWHCWFSTWVQLGMSGLSLLSHYNNSTMWGPRLYGLGVINGQTWRPVLLFTVRMEWLKRVVWTCPSTKYNIYPVLVLQIHSWACNTMPQSSTRYRNHHFTQVQCHSRETNRERGLYTIQEKNVEQKEQQRGSSSSGLHKLGQVRVEEFKKLRLHTEQTTSECLTKAESVCIYKRKSLKMHVYIGARECGQCSGQILSLEILWWIVTRTLPGVSLASRVCFCWSSSASLSCDLLTWSFAFSQIFSARTACLSSALTQACSLRSHDASSDCILALCSVISASTVLMRSAVSVMVWRQESNENALWNHNVWLWLSLCVCIVEVSTTHSTRGGYVSISW